MSRHPSSVVEGQKCLSVQVGICVGQKLEHFNVLLYIILSTTVSFLEDTILILLGLLFFHFVYISKFFSQVHCMCVMDLMSFDRFF